MILHIDFNSFFATVEQQANPRLRGKPVGVSGGPARNALARNASHNDASGSPSDAGGDCLTRTVIGAASVEAKLKGVKTGMRIPEALKLCPDLILVKGDSDKYLSVTKKFINILKGYSDKLEIFSIDEVFLEIPKSEIRNTKYETNSNFLNLKHSNLNIVSDFDISASNFLFNLASDIKSKIKKSAGEWITVSIGISYNKMMAKLAGSLYKPDGLVGIFDEQSARWVLDRVELDEICGIGPRIKNRLNNMGVFNFSDLRKVPLELLLSSFKSYGRVLYNFARGIDETKLVPFFEKEEVKSIGHRHTISHDVSDPIQLKQILLKLCELVARRARAKKLSGKTVNFWFRYAFSNLAFHLSGGSVNLGFSGAGMQTTILHTNDGLDIFKAAWGCFEKLWDGKPVRMVGVSLSNLRQTIPQNLSFLEDVKRREVITRALDKINDRYGEFTLQRGILLNSGNIRRMANSFMSDRRFTLN